MFCTCALAGPRYVRRGEPNGFQRRSHSNELVTGWSQVGGGPPIDRKPGFPAGAAIALKMLLVSCCPAVPSPCPHSPPTHHHSPPLLPRHDQSLRKGLVIPATLEAGAAPTRAACLQCRADHIPLAYVARSARPPTGRLAWPSSTPMRSCPTPSPSTCTCKIAVPSNPNQTRVRVVSMLPLAY